MKDRESKYDTIQKGRLVKVWSVLLLGLYLKGIRLAIGKDHDLLQWSHNLNNSIGRPVH